MAESQERFTYSNADAIKGGLSKERFKPYLQKAGFNEAYAFELYLYNARLSKAFLFPLHILEVVLRNRINEIFVSDFGENWPNEKSFRLILNPESLGSLDIAISRSKSNRTEDIVSTLSFDFWSNLFRDEYDRGLWQTNMGKLTPLQSGETRKSFQNKIKVINKFRNRVAHHEPIHTVDVSSMHKDILYTISIISIDMHDWVKFYSTVNLIIRTKPSSNLQQKPSFSERCDRDFSLVNITDSLSALPKNNFLVCVDTKAEVKAVVNYSDVSSYLLSLADGSDLIVDLSALNVGNVIAFNNIDDNFMCVKGGDGLCNASRIFQTKKIKYILVKNDSLDNIIGVIAKSHRQY